MKLLIALFFLVVFSLNIIHAEELICNPRPPIDEEFENAMDELKSLHNTIEKFEPNSDDYIATTAHFAELLTDISPLVPQLSANELKKLHEAILLIFDHSVDPYAKDLAGLLSDEIKTVLYEKNNDHESQPYFHNNDMFDFSNFSILRHKS